MTAHTDPKKRYDFVYFVDVKNGNPNGDPDFDGMPRIDLETQTGLMTDGCEKRKLRNYVDILKGWEAPFRIYVQNRGYALNDLHKEAYDDLKIKSTGAKIKREEEDKIKAWMCANYWDIRMFGAAMSTKMSAGIVNGPMQITFLNSVDPVVPMPITITRVAVTRPQDLHKSGDDEEGTGEGKRNEMGRRYILPYGLYVGYGFFSPQIAEKTGVTAVDLELFWDALEHAYEYDRSSARGMMAFRGGYIFRHDNARGNAPAHKLIERVKAEKKAGVEFPRSFGDYEITVDNSLPEGVTLHNIGL